MTKPLLLLWTDGAEPYARAIAAAGLADRLRIEALPRAATPDDALLAEAEAMLSWGPPAGMLARMPKLRFVQALTAGVEHWLARADLREDLALSCARGTHRVQMPENILGALFHITKPYAAIVDDNAQARWTRRVSTTLAGQTLGILGPRRDRRGAGAQGGRARDAGDRHQARAWPTSLTRPRSLGRSARTRSWPRATSWSCCCRPRRRPRISSTPRGSRG